MLENSQTRNIIGGEYFMTQNGDNQELDFYRIKLWRTERLYDI